MAPSSGIAVALAFALGALFGRRQAEESGLSRGLAELMKREGSGIPGELKQMTEEERVVVLLPEARGALWDLADVVQHQRASADAASAGLKDNK